MTVRTEPWPHGTPAWVDLAVEDVEVAKNFYQELFGWEYESGGEESGGYLLAKIGGLAVAGIGPRQDASISAVWTTYIGADDVDVTAQVVSDSGGLVIAPPFDVMNSGRMAVVADSTGAVFGIWQAGTHIGAQRVNEHGTLTWNELHTRSDIPARTFYGEVFGYGTREVGEEGFVYSVFQRRGDGAEIAGVLDEPRIPDGGPGYWLAWFAADDVDNVAANVSALGGSVLMPPVDSPFGRMSIVQGPQEETFGIITLPARLS